MSATMARRSLLKSTISGGIAVFAGRLTATAHLTAAERGTTVAATAAALTGSAHGEDVKTLKRYAGEFGGCAKSPMTHGRRVDGRI